MLINNVAISYIIVVALVLIRMHDSIHPVLMLGMIIAGFDAFAFLVLSYKKLGEVNQRSVEFHNSWKRKAGSLDPGMRKRMTRFLRASRPLGIELGEFGRYNRQGSIRVIGKIITYVVKCLMLTNNFGK